MESLTSILKFIVLILNMNKNVPIIYKEATDQRIQFNIVIASKVVWSSSWFGSSRYEICVSQITDRYNNNGETQNRTRNNCKNSYKT